MGVGSPQIPFTPLKNGVHHLQGSSCVKNRKWAPTFVGVIGVCVVSSCMPNEPDALLRCVSNGGFSTFSLKVSGDKATKIIGTDRLPGLVKQQTTDEIVLEFNTNKAPKYCVLKINRLTGAATQTCSDGPKDLNVMDNLHGSLNCSKIERKF